MFHAIVSKKKKKKGSKITFTKCFQNIHPTLVIKSVPQFWHKGVVKANHVIQTKKKKKRQKDRIKEKRRIGREREETENDTCKSASGGKSSKGMNVMFLVI